MSIISTEKVSHSFSDKWLFKDISLGIDRGERVALVGANGSGKSTLLRILAGLLKPNEGRVVTEKGIRIGYLEQEPHFTDFSTIQDFVFNADNEQQLLISQYEKLIKDPEANKAALDAVMEEMTRTEAWEYEYAFKNILTRLGINDVDQEIASLSGGQQKRLALAKLLIDDPDVYILDEPTNHLDIETIEWLENILTNKQKTVLLVTHDRYFLDAVCTEIKEIDQGHFYSYKGNYAYYLQKKAEKDHMDQLLVEKSRNLLKKELEWMRRQPKARGTKSKSRIEAFYELEKKSQSKAPKKSVSLDIKTARQGNKILEIDGISKSFGSKNIIDDFSYTFKKGDRIGLAGMNGSGKSTLINILTGDIEPDSGKVVIGDTTVIGYYKQSGMTFNPQDRVIDCVQEVADYITMSNGQVLTASQLLTNFLFPPQKQHGFIHTLSGGEKKRLQLMRVLMKNPNLLILDEPTNDLDIDTLNVLEEFLEAYQGVLILVSHDRYLLDKLTDQLFVFDGKGEVQIYNGNYTDFKEEQEALKKEEKSKEKIKTSQKKKEQPSEKRKATFKELREYELLTEEIPKLEEAVVLKTKEMSTLEDHVQIANLAVEIETINQELVKKSDRWLELSEII